TGGSGPWWYRRWSAARAGRPAPPWIARLRADHDGGRRAGSRSAGWAVGVVEPRARELDLPDAGAGPVADPLGEHLGQALGLRVGERHAVRARIGVDQLTAAGERVERLAGRRTGLAGHGVRL